jgi:hypothetical protein
VPGPTRPLEVRQATIVKTTKVKDDPTLMTALVTAYTAREREKAQPALPGGGPGGFGNNGMPQPPSMPPGFAPGTNEQKIPDEAYQDPVLNEDVRDDTECTVVLAVVVDPNPPAVTPGGNKTVAVAQPGGQNP